MTAATFAAAQLLRVLPRERITRAVGHLCDLPLPPRLSNAVVGIYVRAYDVDMGEAITPTGAFGSFDDFFTRSLRAGMRPDLGDEHGLVSPADGRVESVGPVERGGELQIKGKPYRVEDLIGDGEDAKRYYGGEFVVVYLHPRDYHRVHTPVAGTMSIVRSMPGDLYPVNAIGERHVASLFSRNRRVAMAIDTPSSGRVTVVMVSAMIVGRVTVTAIEGRDAPIGVHRLEPGPALARGDEIGIFHLGSTAVVFVEPGRFPPLHRRVGEIRVGEPLTEPHPPEAPAGVPGQNGQVGTR